MELKVIIAIAVVVLIRRHFRPGMKLSELAQILDNPTWMKDSNASIVRTLLGYIPLENLSPGTPIAIDLFRELAGTGWSLYFRVSGEIQVIDDFIKVLRGQAVEQEKKDAQVFECAMSTPDFGDEIFWQSGTAEEQTPLNNKYININNTQAGNSRLYKG